MSVVYRGMNEEAGTGRPVLTVPPGAKSLALAARVRLTGESPKARADLSADADGTVYPTAGGMSVNADPADLPHFTVPLRLQNIPPFRSGTAGDACRIWSYPIAGQPTPLTAFAFADRLTLRMGGGTHGGVEPAESMHHTAYNTAIAATRTGWRIDEPAVPTRTGVAP